MTLIMSNAPLGTVALAIAIMIVMLLGTGYLGYLDGLRTSRKNHRPIRVGEPFIVQTSTGVWRRVEITDVVADSDGNLRIEGCESSEEPNK